MKNKTVAWEFLRYVIVGGISAVIDIAVNYVFLYFVFHSDKTNLSHVGFSVAFGFIVGLIVNYILSNIFVFNTKKQKEKGQTVTAFLIYAFVGIVGFVLTEILTLVGTNIIYNSGFWYLFLTCVIKGIVLVWNYLGRKIFVYKGV